MKTVKMKFEVEILVPIDTKEKEEGLKKVIEQGMKVFENDEERENIANEIADVLGTSEEDDFGIKIINDSYEVIEV